MSISQEKRWELNYVATKQFIEKHKSLPSKHRIEEHRLLNWIKYNRKLMTQGKLSAKRQEKFEQMLSAAADYRKLNQYSYTSGKAVSRKRAKQELSLF